MGVSTNAIIAFGFDLGEEGDLPDQLCELLEECEHDIEVCLAADSGATLPEYAVGCDYKAYEAERTARLDGIKIDLIPHCSGEYPMYFLAARGSNKLARRGGPQALEVGDFDAQKFGPEVVAAMHAFCERHGIEWREPKWHIFSMWD